MIYIYQNDYKNSKEVALELHERFNAVHIDSKIVTVSDSFKTEKNDINIVVGGDGTFLRVVRNTSFSESPIIGVNTGHLGFFQEVTTEEIPSLIHAIKKDEFTIEPINLLSAKAIDKNNKIKEFYAVNEVLIKGVNSKVTHLDLYIEEVFLEKFSGDGLIVSTSIGSTAYNFSVGGAVVHPHLKTLQISPLAPISSKSYRSLLNPIVMPGDMIIKIVPETTYEKDIIIVQDGKEHEIKNIKSCELSISTRKINRIHLKKDMYWINLKEKFI